MKLSLQVFFSFVLLAMLVVTSWATSYEGVFDGGAKLIREPWGIATLFDTYFAFFTFYIWVLYKESNLLVKLLWLAGIIFLGNIAMAIYCLIEIYKVQGDFQVEKVLLRRK